MAGKIYYVYILASLSGTLYIGITNDLHRRVFEHKQGKVDGFTKQYGVDRLLHWESYDDVLKAIAREKQLKGWRREKKIALFERVNLSWKDLAKDWYESRGPSTRLLFQNRDEQPRSELVIFLIFRNLRRCKQTTYTPKNREFSKKSQALRMTFILRAWYAPNDS